MHHATALVAIRAPTADRVAGTPQRPYHMSSTSNSLSEGEVAGVAIGAVVGGILLFLILCLMLCAPPSSRRRRRSLKYVQLTDKYPPFGPVADDVAGFRRTHLVCLRAHVRASLSPS